MSRNSPTRPVILIIDDDEQIQNLMRELFCGDNECVVAGSFNEALATLRTVSFDLVFSDINFGADSAGQNRIRA